jgi:hypothetical protein
MTEILDIPRQIQSLKRFAWVHKFFQNLGGTSLCARSVIRSTQHTDDPQIRVLDTTVQNLIATATRARNYAPLAK